MLEKLRRESTEEGKCSKVANAGKNKRPRKILAEKYLLDLARRSSFVNVGRAISLEWWRQNSDYSNLSGSWKMKGRIQWMFHFNELDYKGKEKIDIKAEQK